MSLAMKKYVIRNLNLSELSSVDRPAQKGAVAVLMKSQTSGEDVAIRKNAADVAGGDTQPGFTVAQYEDAMFRRADELADKHGITSEQALFKGLNPGMLADREMMDLAHAGEVAAVAAYGRKRGVAA